jgi:hypothetical protein
VSGSAVLRCTKQGVWYPLSFSLWFSLLCCSPLPGICRGSAAQTPLHRPNGRHSRFARLPPPNPTPGRPLFPQMTRQSASDARHRCSDSS